jgi:hypothetical protein
MKYLHRKFFHVSDLEFHILNVTLNTFWQNINTFFNSDAGKQRPLLYSRVFFICSNTDGVQNQNRQLEGY